MDNSLQHKKAFLAAYSELGNITQAAEASEVSRQSHYLWLKDDPQYVKDFENAQQHACDRLEQEARRRAVEGTVKPVFYKGEECGGIREFSDTLLIFLMKGAMPDKYRERTEQKIEHSGSITQPIDLSRFTDEQISQLRALVESAYSGQP